MGHHGHLLVHEWLARSHVMPTETARSRTWTKTGQTRSDRQSAALQYI